MSQMMKHGVLAAILSAGCMSAPPAAASSFTIEGDVSSMTLVAEDATRDDIVAAMVERFALLREGGEVEEGLVNGRFSGTLGQILKSILPEKGYAISYRDGRPVRLTFADRSVGGPAGAANTIDGATATVDAAASSPTRRQATPEASIGGMLERRTYEQVLATKPSEPPAPASSAKTMQQEIAEATARAVRELHALTRGLRGSNE